VGEKRERKARLYLNFNKDLIFELGLKREKTGLKSRTILNWVTVE
jgi:hypothetical protein